MESAFNFQDEFEFTEAHFSKVKKDLYENAGILLEDHKKDMACNRLVRRLRALELNSYDSYFNYIEANPNELRQFVNVLTANLSAFYQQQQHFDFIAETMLPRLRENRQQQIRGWSAGCGNGEEAYSIVMTLADSLLNIKDLDIKILATDVDASVLKAARFGVYDIDRISMLSRQSVHKYFMKGVGNRSGKVLIRPELQQLICFKYLNLMSDWPMKGQFDFIFCRNVMVYFNRDSQQKLIDKLGAMLKAGGYLFVGQAEQLVLEQQKFNLVATAVYQKRGSFA